MSDARAKFPVTVWDPDPKELNTQEMDLFEYQELLVDRYNLEPTFIN